MNKFSYEGFRERLFDDTFEPVSFFQDEHDRLGSIELALRREGRTYLLSVEALPVHMKRTEDDLSEENSDENKAYVITADEILPDDLVNLKKAKLEDLHPYLTEQDTD